jgi:two-component system, sensor histidine kinase and response regulator
MAPRVLVVDDDARIRRMLVGALGRSGFDVIDADDGAPALLVAAQSPPDIALVDLDMPTSGFEVVKTLKADLGPAVHVTVVSGRDEQELRLRAFDAGADDFVVKPLFVPELLKRVDNAARTQRAYVQARLAHERADRLLAYSAEAAALLAHDLNNGLSIALSNMAYLSTTLKLDEDSQDAMSASLRALRRMSGLVANFVDIARLEDSAITPKMEVVQVRDLFDDVVAIHSPSMRNGTRIEVACEPTLHARFDRALIERVLHNLVGNSARYCYENGLVRISARLMDGPDGTRWLELGVTNTGPQIPDEVRRNLFTKYGRSGAKGQRGMGLYFCRLVCEAHAGTIGEQSAEIGPFFRVRLPFLT